MRILIFSLILAFSWSAASAQDRPALPNLLVILADDLGFSDLGCYGGEIRTPNLDRLAAEGLRLTRFYNTARCWPTRSSLLSGFYPQQIRMDPPNGRLPDWAELLPHRLRPLGYRSYHVGKWHVMELLGPGEVPRAIEWELLSDSQRQFQADKMAIHAAMVDRMDREIGRVVEQLHTMGVFRDTVIFFLSDNGADATIMVRGEGHNSTAEPGSWQSFLCLGPGWASASNTPFRRHKVWVSEGGISTPLIVHWPRGVTARGELRHQVGHVIDLVPTILELTNAPLQHSPPDSTAPQLPGLSLVPVLRDNRSLPREYLYFNHEGNRSLHQGDWKLVSAQEDQNVWELFDLSTDRCEQTNLATVHPDRVREMAALWQTLNTEFRLNAQ